MTESPDGWLALRGHAGPARVDDEGFAPALARQRRWRARSEATS